MPAASVPKKLPWTTASLQDWKTIPTPALPEMTLPSPAALPPTTTPLLLEQLIP